LSPDILRLRVRGAGLASSNSCNTSAVVVRINDETGACVRVVLGSGMIASAGAGATAC
jgi:hypothetical protein